MNCTALLQYELYILYDTSTQTHKNVSRPHAANQGTHRLTRWANNVC
jgi:hypothetical protein